MAQLQHNFNVAKGLLGGVVAAAAASGGSVAGGVALDPRSLAMASMATLESLRYLPNLVDHHMHHLPALHHLNQQQLQQQQQQQQQQDRTQVARDDVDVDPIRGLIHSLATDSSGRGAHDGDVGVDSAGIVAGSDSVGRWSGAGSGRSAVRPRLDPRRCVAGSALVPVPGHRTSRCHAIR